MVKVYQKYVKYTRYICYMYANRQPNLLPLHNLKKHDIGAAALNAATPIFTSCKKLIQRLGY